MPNRYLRAMREAPGGARRIPELGEYLPERRITRAAGRKAGPGWRATVGRGLRGAAAAMAFPSPVRDPYGLEWGVGITKAIGGLGVLSERQRARREAAEIIAGRRGEARELAKYKVELGRTPEAMEALRKKEEVKYTFRAKLVKKRYAAIKTSAAAKGWTEPQLAAEQRQIGKELADADWAYMRADPETQQLMELAVLDRRIKVAKRVRAGRPAIEKPPPLILP